MLNLDVHILKINKYVYTRKQIIKVPVSVNHPLAQFELDLWELNSLFLLSIINLLSEYYSVFLCK